MRYVERNPVRAGITKFAWDYPWSSARAHVFGQEDLLIEGNFLTTELNNWQSFLAETDKISDAYALRSLSNSGRPLGDKNFIEQLELITGRTLHKRKPGPKATNRN
jgi:putative transposase